VLVTSTIISFYCRNPSLAKAKASASYLDIERVNILRPIMARERKKEVIA
jgi:hypothetical protein